MSGGQLVVLDRLGRDVKRYPLPEGLATLGSDPACDIRIMLPTVSPHHATVVVHANQTVVRNVSTGSTLVNGAAVSVAALRHGDAIEIGGRKLRWEYDDDSAPRPLAPQPALYSRGRPSPKRSRRSAAPPPPARSPALRLALELQHRASMPSRQVAVVQPQRRDPIHTGQSTPARQNLSTPARQNPSTPARNPSTPARSTSSKRSRNNDSELDSSLSSEPEVTRKPGRPGARNSLQASATKASLWIESRKPRRAASLSRSHGAGTPLRLTALRRAQSTSNARVAKIQAPTTVDHTKQAALLLMTRHTPKKSSPGQPSLVIKKRTPRASPKDSPRNSPAETSRSKSRLSSRVTSLTSGRKARGRAARAHDSVSNSTVVSLSDSQLSQSSSSSPPLPSPRKSALRDPAAKRHSRKTESIKFDLSNLLDSRDLSQDDVTLHYDSSIQSPSPRKSIHSRSSRILEQTLGTTLSEPQTSIRTLTPTSPRPRKSSRVSVIIQNALEPESRYSQRTTKSLSEESYDTVASAFKTRTLSPKSPGNMESYSIVDLVSVDSNQSPSVYNSMRSTKSDDTAFGTPRNSSERKTRSTIDPSLISSSTPYVAKVRKGSKRSLSNPNVSVNSKTFITRGSKRSKSWSTPENTQKHISINSTRVSRASRSRSRLNDSDLLLISTVSDDDSPKSSKRASRATKSGSPKSVISPKSITASIRKSKSISSTDSSPSTDRSKSILNPRSPITSPKNVSAASRKTKSLSPKTILSPKTNISVTRKSKSLPSNSPLPSPKFNISTRKTRSVGSNSPSLSSVSISTTTRKTKSLSSPKGRKTLSKLSITPSPTNDGVITPENRQSPVEVGTPVLSIQSLLDSSQSSFTSLRSNQKGRASSKRKTFAGILPKPKKGRASLKSKSFNFGARKTASTISRDSDDTLSSQNEDIVTPKSAVKLVQEAVKNKHSTAKKPQSKRSIIDDLNESDIVKQLFNSPVKRKLSQSMTEFSRKQLFDDDDVITIKKPTRNTVALGRTPDTSLLNETEPFTPEVFVSPLGTPSNSPNLTGIKRLFKKQTPENDLRNVKGVKGLLRTPRVRRSVRNDLTRVSGVKNVFAKSPKNRLSDVRVKEVFAASPKNDLRRVTGVKSLFRSQKKRKSPKNDLRDVRGVKQLFVSSSPVNDLRNVSGVKKVLRRNSPRNDLSDVRGVRNMFRQERRREEIADVSGIEELFDESNNSYRDGDSLFDKLIGKPTIKAVYSRTFTKKYEKAKKNRSGALHASIDEIIAKPEEWIQKELQKRFQQPNVSRELQKLATDTVEGSAPIRHSRVRTSVVSPRKRSADYKEHTLPLKKRSLDSRPSSQSSQSSQSSRGRSLPLKKRVVHSTPVKGRGAMPELGRVSPIALDNDQRFTTTEVDVPVLQTSRRNTKMKADRSKVEIIVTSPKKTRGKVSVAISPKKAPSPKQTVISPKNTRNTRKNESVSKKRATIVVTKNPPVMSPKPKQDEQVKSPSPKKRTTRRQKGAETTVDVEKPKSPKKTRGKRVSLVVSKPSPKMKPATKAKISKAEAKVQEVPEKQRRTRKTTAPTESVDKKTESPKEPTRAIRNRKTAEAAKEPIEKAKKSKTPKTKDESVGEKPAKTRGKKTEVSVEIKKTEGRATRGKKSEPVEQKVEAPKRGKKAEKVVEEKSKKGKNVEVEKPVAQKRGKKVEVVEQKPAATRRGRNTETAQEIESKPVRRGRSTKAEEEKSESPKRGRKTVEAQKPAAQTRGKKTEIAQKEVKVAQKRGQKVEKTAAQTSSSASPKAKRGKASEPAPEKKTRGRKAETEVEVKSTRSVSKSETNRKRKSTGSEEVPRKARKTRAGDVPRPAADRTRGKQPVAEAAPASRKRKMAAGTPVKSVKAASKRASPAARPAPRETKKSTRGKR